MSAAQRPDGEDVFGDFDPAELVRRANAGQTPVGQPEPGRSTVTATGRLPWKPGQEWDRVAFNCKISRWVRHEARRFALERGEDIQDVQERALVLLMRSEGWPVDAARPTTPAPPGRQEP